MPDTLSASGVVFRPETAADREFLYSVYASTRSAEMALTPWSAAEKEGFLRSQFHLQSTYYAQQFGTAEFLLILVDGEQAGRLYIDRLPPDHIHIIDIALLPAFRGHGVGGGILREILNQAGAAGKSVRIFVERDNPALRLYARLGFAPIADKGVYLQMEWKGGRASADD